MLNITIVILGSYLLGSFPSAYIVSRYFSGIDLRLEGSRNIGARNAYEVTGKRRVGLLVLLFDVLKGAIPMLMFRDVGDVAAILAVAIVLGHCYPIWLRFHGGRGLATTAAILILLSPIHIGVWLAVYFFSGLVRNNVHLQSLVATIGCIVVELAVDTTALTRAISPIVTEQTSIAHYCLLLIFSIIISRHIQPVRAYLKTTP